MVHFFNTRATLEISWEGHLLCPVQVELRCPGQVLAPAVSSGCCLVKSQAGQRETPGERRWELQAGRWGGGGRFSVEDGEGPAG